MSSDLVRGYLLHITHYDPVWVAKKAEEPPFDLETGLAVLDALAAQHFNMLLIDCFDGLLYRSHPELARPYSVPMTVLERLVTRAGELGLEVVPKLNFAQSALHQHNHWFRPHNDLFDTEEYWTKAFEVIDELLEVCKPPHFFHIGMDEDHSRSYTQYVQAIQTLRDGLQQRNLRTIIWNDSACDWPAAQIHVEKSLLAEEKIATDIVQVLWDYWDVRPSALRRLVQRGFTTWAAPGNNPDQAGEWRQAVLDEGGSGLLLTNWNPCQPDNRDKLLERINNIGSRWQ